MPLYKQVNGERIELSPEEEASTLAEWAKNDALSVKQKELQLLLDQVPALDERLKAIEYCLLNHVPSIKNGAIEERDDHVRLLQKCQDLEPLIKEKKLELEAK